MNSLVLSSAKEEYKSFIRKQYVPLYFRDTYLDLVCDSEWDVVLAKEGDQIVAAYIYMLKQKFGLKYIVQPQLCPYTGPLFFNGKTEKDLFERLVKALPRHHLCIQDFFFELPDLLGNKNVDYKKHTYTIAYPTDIDQLWNLQSSTHRRIIRKAERELTYEVESDMDVFLTFVSRTFDYRKKHNPNDPEIFRKVDAALNENGQRKIVKCLNAKNEIVAMCYLMHDERWTFNFANSVIEDYKHYGMNLILWNEIKASLEAGRSFDFEGSMIPGVDKFFQRYKGKKTSYPSRHYSKNSMIDLLVKLKS